MTSIDNGPDWILGQNRQCASARRWSRLADGSARGIRARSAVLLPNDRKTNPPTAGAHHARSWRQQPPRGPSARADGASENRTVHCTGWEGASRRSPVQGLHSSRHSPRKHVRPAERVGAPPIWTKDRGDVEAASGNVRSAGEGLANSFVGGSTLRWEILCGRPAGSGAATPWVEPTPQRNALQIPGLDTHLPSQ